VPSCASKELLTGHLRDSWGFEGYVTSDCGAVSDVANQHNFTKTPDTCAAVPDATPEPARFRAAGMDLDRYRSHL
jgi:hypothetical protein